MLELTFLILFTRQNSAQSEGLIRKTAIRSLDFFWEDLQEIIGYIIIQEYCFRNNFSRFVHGKYISECNMTKNLLQNAIFVYLENKAPLFPYESAIIREVFLQSASGAVNIHQVFWRPFSSGET